MKIRLWVKRFIVWVGFGDYIIEFCDVCGVKQPLDWWCSDHLFAKLNGSTYGCLCPICMDRAAFSIGWSLRWEPRISFIRREFIGAWQLGSLLTPDDGKCLDWLITHLADVSIGQHNEDDSKVVVSLHSTDRYEEWVGSTPREAIYAAMRGLHLETGTASADKTQPEAKT